MSDWTNPNDSHSPSTRSQPGALGTPSGSAQPWGWAPFDPGPRLDDDAELDAEALESDDAPAPAPPRARAAPTSCVLGLDHARDKLDYHEHGWVHRGPRN